MRRAGTGSSARQPNEPTTTSTRTPRTVVTDKLDEIVADQWRDTDDYLEPLTGAPYSKLRIGQFRLGAECDHDEKMLDIYTIEHRSGAYKADDD